MKQHQTDRSEFHRFDSVTALLEFCRQRYGTDDVTATNEGGEFRVMVRLHSGRTLTSLIVHYEGARTYLVRLEPPKS